MLNRYFEKKFYKYLFSFYIRVDFNKFNCNSIKIESFMNDFKENVLKTFSSEIKEEFIFDLFTKNPYKSVDYENIGKFFIILNYKFF